MSIHHCIANPCPICHPTLVSNSGKRCQPFLFDNALTQQACAISMTRNTITIECDEREEAEQLFDWLTEYPFNSHEAALSEYLELALGVISANKKMLWTGEDAARQALTDYKESIR